jgi:cell division protein FtsA
VRHTNELPTETTTVSFSETKDIPIAPPALDLNIKEKMVNLTQKKEKKSEEANAFSKFWNWATQLF